MVPGVRFLIGLRGCAVGLPERRGTTSAMAFLEGDEDPTEDLVLGRVGAIFFCMCVYLGCCLFSDNNQKVRNVWSCNCLPQARWFRGGAAGSKQSMWATGLGNTS